MCLDLPSQTFAANNGKHTLPKPSVKDRITKKAAQRAEIETFKKDAAKVERGKVSKRFRRMIFDRDGWKCVKCGASGEGVKLVLAHVRPIAQGGETTEENCQCWCFDCNSGQGAATPVKSEAELRAAHEWRIAKDKEAEQVLAVGRAQKKGNE